MCFAGCWLRAAGVGAWGARGWQPLARWLVGSGPGLGLDCGRPRHVERFRHPTPVRGDFVGQPNLVCAVPLSVLTAEHAQRAFRLAVALDVRQGALQFWLNGMLQCRVEFTPPSPSRWSSTDTMSLGGLQFSRQVGGLRPASASPASSSPTPLSLCGPVHASHRARG